MTNQVDFTKVKKIHQTNHPIITNKYLDAGWVLLNVVPNSDPSHGSDALYVLGWNKEGEAIAPKIDYSQSTL